MIGGQNRSASVPVARIDARNEARVGPACRVFQPRCRPAELIEPGDCGVEVRLVEDLAAVDQVVFDREEIDP